MINFFFGLIAGVLMGVLLFAVLTANDTSNNIYLIDCHEESEEDDE